MGDDGVVMCKSNGAVEQRYNSGKSTPTLLDTSDRSIGISNANVTFLNDWLICSFTRSIKNDSIKNYFDLNNNYIILAATGQYDSPIGIKNI
jgi:hypothetical protein